MCGPGRASADPHAARARSRGADVLCEPHSTRGGQQRGCGARGWERSLLPFGFYELGRWPPGADRSQDPPAVVDELSRDGLRHGASPATAGPGTYPVGQYHKPACSAGTPAGSGATQPPGKVPQHRVLVAKILRGHPGVTAAQHQPPAADLDQPARRSQRHVLQAGHHLRPRAQHFKRTGRAVRRGPGPARRQARRDLNDLERRARARPGAGGRGPARGAAWFTGCGAAAAATWRRPAGRRR